ncbi:hypothetical protein ACFQ49_05830 [Kroppenstedtia eburnea]|uniref:Uncharacterized protein n=1 Tax=Kroppenstedtia eburnea TaxID=714067 RepID=A0A1N7ITR9_9BACL|nr:hypothetical protein [Kroppenstedtia eburnea]EGK13704.1 hypothetical protein HMPREF9374_0647 [Desmospora sp. 8437]QKI82190.1 hypothetical protein GXN75_09360 [Kroppenstedtia eburnea]SIS40464.1 hypothetical protein SAMN05421790_101356 [Kroppenstedtia eburnea]
MLGLFNDEEKRKMMIEKTRRFLEKGFEKGKVGVQKAWEEYREERARRERDKAYEEDYEAEFRFREGDMDFRMLISAEEARLYERARRKLKEVKLVHSDPRIHHQWESKKYLTLHDYFTERIQHYYQRRNEDPVALHRTIRFCERQIEYAPVAVRAYRMDPYNFNLPEHPGYETLISLYEEVGEWHEALRLARKAKKQGWEGDWDARIRELEDRVGTS